MIGTNFLRLEDLRGVSESKEDTEQAEDGDAVEAVWSISAARLHAISLTFGKEMKIIIRASKSFVALLISIVAVGDVMAEDGKSPVSEAVTTIDESLSQYERRAIIAGEMRRRGDNPGADLVSPFEGHIERRQLVDWIEEKWNLSDESEFRTYFNSRGILGTENIASVLITAWLERLRGTNITEEELLQRERRSQELLRFILSRLDENNKPNKAEEPTPIPPSD